MLTGCGGTDTAQQQDTQSENSESAEESVSEKEETDNNEDKAEAEDSAETLEDDPEASAVNPWSTCTEEEASALVPRCFTAPQDAENVEWSVMQDDDDLESANPLVQMTFDYLGLSFTAREQGSNSGEMEDISGMYYDWDYTDDITLANWADGNMPAVFKAYSGDDETAQLCQWFDIETGYSYSLGVTAEDLDGFDLQAVAEAIYDPEKNSETEGSNLEETGAETTDAEDAEDTEESTGEDIGAEGDLDENSIEFIKKAAEEYTVDIDTEGCDTFTQIVDEKLSSGMGYANTTISDTDVLLVTSGTYDNLDGNMAAIDATVFMYKDDVPYLVGSLCSGGTAYPITVKDGMVYTGSNHWICKYALTDGKLMITEKASVVYDTDGNGTYYYESEDGGDYSNMSSDEAEKIFDSLVDEMAEGEVVNFSTVE